MVQSIVNSYVDEMLNFFNRTVNVIFCECFIKVSKHKKTDESMRLKAGCVYCFREFGNPDET